MRELPPLFPLTNIRGEGITRVSRHEVRMAKDANQSRGGKAPSLDSRLLEAEVSVVFLQAFCRNLCEALLVELDDSRRSKILALLATMSDTGRGARAQSHGE